MRYNMEEPAEEKIAKQALLEALFETQLWMEPYVRNPFIYITDHESDFESDKGQRMEQYFKKVFFSQYTKYRDIVKQTTPDDYYLLRA